jgi:hypothetical protein
MVHVEKVKLSYVPEKFQGHTNVKSGNRVEYPLDLADPLVQNIQEQLNIGMPLRFASLMEARPSNGPSQEFHADSYEKRLNALVYLTDVLDESFGPIEFESVGPVLGSKGTAVIYPASEMHRGVANHAEVPRMALALAFSDSETKIQTIGFVAPESDNRWAFVISIIAILGILFILFSGRRK